MHRFTSSSLHATILAASLLLSTTAVAQEEFVTNDSFDNMQMGTASLEPSQGEMYAATFNIPQSWLPIEMLGVRVLMVPGMGGGNYCGRFMIEVWEEPNKPSTVDNCTTLSYEDPDIPMDEIYSMSRQFSNSMNPIAFSVQGDPNNFQDLRFSSINNNPGLMTTINPVIINVERVRVGVLAYDLACSGNGGTNFPIMLTDADGIQAENWAVGNLFPMNCPMSFHHYAWAQFAPFFFNQTPGDFVMRLILKRNVTNPMPDMGMGMPDMGMDMPAEMGGGDMMVVDIGPDGSMTVVDMMEDQGGEPDFGEPDSGGEPDIGEPDFGGEPDSGGEVDLGGNGMGEDMATVGNNDSNNSTNNNTPAGMLEVTSVSPSSVAEGESAEIAILGKNFETGLEVTLDARKIGVVETTAQRILATAPGDLAPASYDVIVTNPSGDSAILSGGFTVTAATDMSDGQTMDMGAGNGQNGGRAETPDSGCGCRQAQKSPSVPTPLLAMVLGLVGLVGWRRRKN